MSKTTTKKFENVSLKVDFTSLNSNTAMSNITANENIATSFAKIAHWYSKTNGFTSTTVNKVSTTSDGIVSQLPSSTGGFLKNTGTAGGAWTTLGDSDIPNTVVRKTGNTGLSGRFEPTSNDGAELGRSNYRFKNIYGTHLFGTDFNGFTIEKSVPSDAVFTDHIATATTTGAGAGKAVTSISDDGAGNITAATGSFLPSTTTYAASDTVGGDALVAKRLIAADSNMTMAKGDLHEIHPKVGVTLNGGYGNNIGDGWPDKRYGLLNVSIDQNADSYGNGTYTEYGFTLGFYTGSDNGTLYDAHLLYRYLGYNNGRQYGIGEWKTLLTDQDIVQGTNISVTSTNWDSRLQDDNHIKYAKKVTISHETINTSASTASSSLSFGGTFTSSYISSMDNGHVEAYKNSTFTLPSLPDGTTSQKGIVKLSSSTSSTSTSLAATPSAVKSAYDLANEGKQHIISDEIEDAVVFVSREPINIIDTISNVSQPMVARFRASAFCDDTDITITHIGAIIRKCREDKGNEAGVIFGDLSLEDYSTNQNTVTEYQCYEKIEYDYSSTRQYVNGDFTYTHETNGIVDYEYSSLIMRPYVKITTTKAGASFQSKTIYGDVIRINQGSMSYTDPGKFPHLGKNGFIAATDKSDNSVNIIGYNGTNLWIGTGSASSPQFDGQLMLAAGKGQTTARIYVANAANTASTGYDILHTGNTSFTANSGSSSGNDTLGVLTIDGTDNTIKYNDKKVLHSQATGNNFRPILLGSQNASNNTDAGNITTLNTSATNQVYLNAKMVANPSTGEVRATKLTATDTITIDASSTTNPFLWFKHSSFTNAQSSPNCGIRAYLANNAGMNMTIQSGGNLIIGSGEFPTNLYNRSANDSNFSMQYGSSSYYKPTDTSENTWIGSDNNIYLFTNTNNIGTTENTDHHYWQFNMNGKTWLPKGKGLSWTNSNGYTAEMVPGSNTAGITLTLPSSSGTLSLDGHTHSYIPLSGSSSITGNLVPSGNRNLGSSSSKWNNLYVNNINGETPVDGNAIHGSRTYNSTNSYNEESISKVQLPKGCAYSIGTTLGWHLIATITREGSSNTNYNIGGTLLCQTGNNMSTSPGLLYINSRVGATSGIVSSQYLRWIKPMFKMSATTSQVETDIKYCAITWNNKKCTDPTVGDLSSSTYNSTGDITTQIWVKLPAQYLSHSCALIDQIVPPASNSTNDYVRWHFPSNVVRNDSSWSNFYTSSNFGDPANPSSASSSTIVGKAYAAAGNNATNIYLARYVDEQVTGYPETPMLVTQLIDLTTLSWTRSGQGLYYSSEVTISTTISSTSYNCVKVYAVHIANFSNLKETDNVNVISNSNTNKIRVTASTNSFYSSGTTHANITVAVYGLFYK